MGGKFRIRKQILPIILKDRKPGQWYVEPFCGGCNTLSEVEGNRIGNDVHYYLIEMWRAVSKGWIPPKSISGEEYQLLKSDPDRDPTLAGYVGFVMSFGSRWFSSYVKPESQLKFKRKPKDEASYQSALKEFPKLRGVHFFNLNYRDLYIPNGDFFSGSSIVYCDPPYQGTCDYGTYFNHDEFWQWCRDKSREGHQVFISEYNAPDDFECLWSKSQINHLNGSKHKNSIERLFKAP